MFIKCLFAFVYKNLANPGSFGSIEALYKSSKLANINVSKKEVAQFLSTVPTFGVFHSAKKQDLMILLEQCTSEKFM